MTMVAARAQGAVRERWAGKQNPGAEEPALPSLPALGDVEGELARRSLRDFVELLWGQIEPRPFVGGWHLDAICAHLEAVTRGDVRRLIINIPPKHTKSLTVCVFWPAWSWLQERRGPEAPLCGPQAQFLFASYAYPLAMRDSVRCRRLMTSARYRALLGGAWTFAGDQNAKERFENTAGGYRLATSVGGMATGEGGDAVVVDDPHNVIEGESDAVREGVLEWWDESMSSRLHDPKTGARVVIMQRVHERDLCGHILAKPGARREWDHLCLPARYEGRDRVVSTLGFCDPRTRDGEPLSADRFGEAELAALEADLGEYAAAGQLQQRPAPREGGMFKPDAMPVWDELPAGDSFDASVRYWDKASNTKTGQCQTAGVRIVRLRKEERGAAWVVADVHAGNWDPAQREAEIQATAGRDSKRTDVYVEQEPGSGGKDSAWATIRSLAGYVVRADRPTGDKERRAEPFAAQANIGRVAVLRRPWTQKFLGQLRGFPRGLKDQVDAASGAFGKLVRRGSGAARPS